jgi:hypothetical protein
VARLVVSGILRAALGGDWEAEASLPVSWLEAADERGEESRTGTGDLLTRLHWGRRAGAWGYGLSAGAFWPVGELGSGDLPTTANFSSGTVDPVLGLQVGRQVGGDLEVSLATTARLVVADHEEGRRLGSSLTTSLSLRRPLSRAVSLQLLCIHLARGEDQGNAMEDTGGEWLYLQPLAVVKLRARPDHALQGVLGGRFPLAQNVRGRQLVDSPALVAGLALTL